MVLNVVRSLGKRLSWRGGLAIILMGLWPMPTPLAQAQSSPVERGRYLVRIGGCDDCHTPGHMLGKADETRFLGGSDIAFAVPSLGAFVAPNLTPDKDTGLGKWSKEQIVTAITMGVRPDGRILAPIMPWRSFAALTPADADAIADYLRSIPPVHHLIPDPFAVGVTPPVPVMRLVFPKAGRSAG